MLRSSLELKQKAQGARHPSTAHAWILLGLSQNGGEAFAAAESSFAMATDIYRETMPQGHNSIGRALEGLGRARLGQGQLDDAESPLLESLEIRREALTPGHREICAAMSALGKLRLEQGRLAESEQLLVEAYEWLKGSFGVENKRTRGAARTLVELYQATGDSAKVAEYRALGAES